MGGIYSIWYELSTYFSIRVYPAELVKSAFLKVNSKDRKNILLEKETESQNDSKKLFLILDYNSITSTFKGMG